VDQALKSASSRGAPPFASTAATAMHLRRAVSRGMSLEARGMSVDVRSARYEDVCTTFFIVALCFATDDSTFSQPLSEGST